MANFTTGFFMAVALCVTFTANAARPSFTSLQQQINQLQAENNAQQAQINTITNSEAKILQPGQAVWVDANGTMLGDVQTNVGLTDVTRIYFEVNETFYGTGLNSFTSDGIEKYEFWGGELFYDQPGCTGNTYKGASEKYEGGIIFSGGGREGVIYAEDGDTPQTVEVLSSWLDRGYSCYQFGEVICDSPELFNCLNVLDFQTEPLVYDDVYPAVPIVDTNIYTKPFRLKLTLPN